MALALDLSASREKHKRALEHLGTLKREAPLRAQERKPYTLITDFDEETGWLSIKVRPESPDIYLSVVIGELIHDLRSALDYIVASLVQASDATLTTAHQFPIYSDETRYDNRVGTAAAPTGPLAGIRYGFTEIRLFQPFILQPNPAESALAGLQRLSNADKHRGVLAFASFPISHGVRVTHDGTIIEEWEPTGPIVWEPYSDSEILRLRFAEPYPTQMDPEAELMVQPSFIDPPFPPDYPDTILFSFKSVGELCGQVSTIIDEFATM